MRRYKQYQRTIRTLGLVIACYIYCWGPYSVMWPLIAYCPECVPLPLYHYTFWVAILNSAINPCLYFISNKDFREAFVVVILRKKK